MTHQGGRMAFMKEVASENYCPLEGQIEAKDYDTDIIEVTGLQTQYKNQHGKNKQEIKSERVQHSVGSC